MILVASPFLKKIDVGQGKYLLYHALFCGGAVVGKDAALLLRRFARGKEEKEFLESNPDPAYRAALAKLKKCHFLVPKGSDEYSIVAQDNRKTANVLQKGKGMEFLRLELASDCNFSCKHCYCPGMPEWDVHAAMSWVTAKKAVDGFLRVLRSNGSTIGHVSFFGGEPLLNWKVAQRTVEYVEAEAKRSGLEISTGMCTNASLLSDATLRFIKKHRMHVRASLDGLQEANDRFRIFKNGKGTFSCVSRTFTRMKKAGIHFSVQCCLNDYNFYSVEQLIDFLQDSYAVHAMALDVIEWRTDGLEYDTHTNEEKAQRLLEIYAHAQIRKFAVGGPWLNPATSIAQDHKGKSFCGGAYSTLYVRPSGTVYMCENLAIPLGTVSDLDAVFKGAPYSTILRRRTGALKACRGCPIEGPCTGGCLANAYCFSGDIYDTSHPMYRSSYCDLALRIFKKMARYLYGPHTIAKHEN